MAASNPSIKFGGYEATEIIASDPEIKNCFWSSDKEGKNKIDEAHLENTVYFHIATKGISRGTLKLQLFDEDTFSDDDEFAGEKLYKTVEINRNKGVVELELPDSWAADLKDEDWPVGPTVQYRKLYWKATCGDKIKNEKISSFLKVSYSERELYIKPSQIDDKFPEVYSVEGELMHVVVAQACGFVRDEITGDIVQVIEKGAKKLALNMLEKGHLVDNQGVVHRIGESEYVNDTRIKGVTISTNEGILIETRQSKNFTYSAREGGARVVHTTKGVNQYGYWVDKSESRLFNIKGLLKYTGEIFDVFDLFSFAKDPDHNSPLPLFAVAPEIGFVWNVIGIIAYDQFDRMVGGANLSFDRQLQQKLDEAKLNGLRKVKELLALKTQVHPQAGYELWDISPEIASRIIQGEFKNIDDIIGESYNYKEYERNIIVLFRRTQHPISNNDITIIETFFIEEI